MFAVVLVWSDTITIAAHEQLVAFLERQLECFRIPKTHAGISRKIYFRCLFSPHAMFKNLGSGCPEPAASGITSVRKRMPGLSKAVELVF